MTTLTVTTKGQITLRKNLLQHLGVDPGQKIEVSTLPGGKLEIRAARPEGNIAGFIGLLAGKTSRVATLEELSAAAAKAWTGDK